MADLKALFQLPPAEAVAYMQARGLLSPTFSWQDMLREENAVQFTVSKLSRLDLLDAIYRECAKNAAQGQSLRDFAKNLRPLLEKEGWWGKRAVIDPKTGEIGTTTFDPARLKLIYDVNLRTAHAAGLWERIERNKGTHPYIRYVTRRDERVRHSHKAWDNLTLPIDHPFWKTHYPPNGWRCRCRVVAMTQAEYDAGIAPDGRPLVKDAPEIQMADWKDRNGAIHQIPAGIDPGWDYNPGKAALRAKNLEQVTADKLDAAAPIREAAVKAGLGDNAGMKEPLMPAGLPERQYLDTFFTAVGGSGKRALLGADTIIDEHLFLDSKGAVKVTKRGRERFVKQLAETILAPDEVYETEEAYRMEPGNVLIKRRFLRIFEIGADKFGTVVSFSRMKGNDAPFVGSTAFVPINSKGEPDWSYFEKQKAGEMIFQKENPTGRNTAG